MLSVANKPIMLSVVMLNIIMLSVIMLNVVAPWRAFSSLMLANKVGANKQTNDWTIKARQGVNTLAYLSGGSVTKAKESL